jgi:hypothetical protein
MIQRVTQQRDSFFCSTWWDVCSGRWNISSILWNLRSMLWNGELVGLKSVAAPAQSSNFPTDAD